MADPINISEPVRCTRVKLTFEGLWRLAQRALARQVGDKRVGQLQIARAILRLAARPRRRSSLNAEMLLLREQTMLFGRD